MRRHRSSSISLLRWVALLLFFLAILLTILQLVSYSRIRSDFPLGQKIAGISVSGLDRQEAAQRILQAYSIPVEIHYGEAVIQIKPSSVGFELDLESMLAAADMIRVNQPFWEGFWDQLWNRSENPPEIPLRSSFSEDRLRTFLKDEVASRYDLPPAAAVPVAGSTNFGAGQQGTSLNIDRAVILIEDALRSPTSRIVNLSYNRISPPRPSFQNLQILLKQILTVSGFEGVMEFYLLDLQTNQELHFTYQSGTDQPPAPDIAFSAESTIKIPIMVSAFRHSDGPLSEEAINLMQAMIDQSKNPPADDLMDLVMDRGKGPLEVTNDMRAIGLENTFLGAYMGKPLFLQKFDTPANQRTDIHTDPDIYNQTTAADMGMLLNDIYQCAQYGGGTLLAAFQGAITQNECQEMINYLSMNQIGVLFQAGLPEGTRFAHKHAWANTNDGLIHTFGDVGIAYTPGGNFVISAFMYNVNQLVYEPTNQLYAKLAEAVNNYYNQSTP